MGFVSKRGRLVRSRSVPFRGRKGDVMNEFYYILFQLMLVLLVLVALIQYVNATASGLKFEKRFASMDIALLATTVNYVPGTLKHLYSPMPFEIPMGLKFENNTAFIIESGSAFPPIVFWYLSGINRDMMDDTAVLTGTTSAGGSFATTNEIIPPILTFYRTGRKATLDHENINALHQECPVVNTSHLFTTKSTAIYKVFTNPEDERDEKHPVNLLVQNLRAQYSDTFIFPEQNSDADSNLRIYIGDSGQARGPGSLVAFIPIDEDILLSRKLACYAINDLLTDESFVVYTQIMPVNTADLEEDSPLNALKSTAQNATIFLDISGFEPEQIDYRNTSRALNTAVQRYYGREKITIVEGKTLSADID